MTPSSPPPWPSRSCNLLSWITSPILILLARTSALVHTSATPRPAEEAQLGPYEPTLEAGPGRNLSPAASHKRREASTICSTITR
eukprot:4025693-Pyramimonas_sp.AAC.1